MGKNRLSWQITLFVLFVCVGLLLSVRLVPEGRADYLEQQDPEDLIAMWKDLDVQEETLRQSIADVKNQEFELSNQSSASEGALSAMQSQLSELCMVNGSEAVRGPGVRVSVSGDPPLLYLDVVDLINELWASGAEAVAVNGIRVTGSTAFYFAETDTGIYITAGGISLHYPIIVEAIGDPQTLEKGLIFPGGIIDNFNTLYDIFPKIEKLQEIKLPARKDLETRISPSSRSLIEEAAGK